MFEKGQPMTRKPDPETGIALLVSLGAALCLLCIAALVWVMR